MQGLSESGLKYIVASIVFLFLLQEVITQKYISEPYPSLRMPPFSGTNMNDDGFYEATSVDIKIYFRDEDSLVLSPRDFFHDAPISHHWSLINKFKPAAPTTKSTSYEKYSSLKSILPGFFISRSRSNFDIQTDPETHQWLRDQIFEFSPDRTPEKISFYWFTNQYDPDNLLDFDQELTDSTVVML